MHCTDLKVYCLISRWLTKFIPIRIFWISWIFFMLNCHISTNLPIWSRKMFFRMKYSEKQKTLLSDSAKGYIYHKWTRNLSYMYMFLIKHSLWFDIYDSKKRTLPNLCRMTSQTTWYSSIVLPVQHIVVFSAPAKVKVRESIYFPILVRSKCFDAPEIVSIR